MDKKTLIMESLFDIKAVLFRPKAPFLWSSGIKSPIYCDNRKVLSFPLIRDELEIELSKIVQKKYENCEVLAGVETAGIAHAALVAEKLNLPMVYVRKKRKSHGTESLIEGRIKPKQKVVVIEDLISTAGSVINAVQALRDEIADVLGVVSIFSYGIKLGKDALLKEEITNYSLLDCGVLLDVLIKRGTIKEGEKSKIKNFIENLTPGV
ncbi:MAG: orotate phosphoribosyltransferase [Oscillospiraceae bacterium]|jgi:orotate phosphoribosyltransferase|nr:orotate phosphoribosyltransferase [Oscillospiraceae bacterium]